MQTAPDWIALNQMGVVNLRKLKPNAARSPLSSEAEFVHFPKDYHHLNYWTVNSYCRADQGHDPSVDEYRRRAQTGQGRIR